MELAVFGSLLILLLGYVVNNALNYDYQQSATMEVFRRGLASAAGSVLENTPTSTGQLLIQDRHIPDPSDPFGLGSVTPVTAQANVTRNYQLQNVPERPSELPHLAIQIDENSPPHSYTTAGFRDEFDVLGGSLERYRFIYGGQNVCDKPECGGGNGACLSFGEPVQNPETGMEDTPCLEYAKHVKIIDTCAGEILNKTDCLSLARQITNSGACSAACQKSGQTDCATMCNQPMNTPPWAGALDGKEFGLKAGSEQTIAKNNTLTKDETETGVQTTEHVDFTTTTTRKVGLSNGSEDSITTVRSEQPPDETRSTSW